MDRLKKIAEISRLPLFSELDREAIELIEPLFRLETYQAGEYVYRQAERSYALYLFLSGRGSLLRVDSDGIERRGDDVMPGEYVGERSLFLHDERPHSLVIIRDAEVLVLPRRDFDEFIRRHPKLKARLNVRNDIRAEAPNHDFPWLEPGELVLAYKRRHQWAFWRRAVLAVPLLVVFSVVPILLYAAGLPTVLVVAGAFPMLFFPLITIIYNYLDWRNDWFVVTNQRVVHEERVLLTFNETRQQAPLNSIQTVRTAQDSYWADQFDFGNLLISTAGAGGTLVFDTIPKPDDLAEVISQELNRTGAHRAAQSREEIRRQIDRFLGTKALNRTHAEDLPPPLQQPSEPPPPKSVQTRLEEFWARVARYFDMRVRIDEDFRVTYRKHWLVLWNDIFAPTFVFFLMLILLIINLIWHGDWPWNMFQPVVRIVFFLLGFPAIGAWWWYMYEDWHNDLYIIEKQTITRIHRRPLWMEDDQSTILIRNVQGVNVSVNGIWQKLFNYGTVIVQTAADDDVGENDDTSGEIHFEYVYQPHALQEDILRQQRRTEAQEDRDDQEMFAEQIARWLAVYHQATHPEDFDTGYMPGDYVDKGRVQ